MKEEAKGKRKGEWKGERIGAKTKLKTKAISPIDVAPVSWPCFPVPLSPFFVLLCDTKS